MQLAVEPEAALEVEAAVAYVVESVVVERHTRRIVSEVVAVAAAAVAGEQDRHQTVPALVDIAVVVAADIAVVAELEAVAFVVVE